MSCGDETRHFSMCHPLLYSHKDAELKHKDNIEAFLGRSLANDGSAIYLRNYLTYALNNINRLNRYTIIIYSCRYDMTCRNSLCNAVDMARHKKIHDVL
ncbi:hypothetical protein CEXT_158271 [Caerostris extrusa]|uniref:C2H2-type domain-containing protein n=1 Tax=Caerostris extrusa TaxID=172846 RepID=A0AAV4P7J1_CAEEX|nr:hypothetical protein CEXT_158271 [Caerostris extrusa]